MYILGIDKSKINNGFKIQYCLVNGWVLSVATTTTSAFAVLNEVQSNP
jgi:hypothetical protein